jgi:hypothetical protein
MAASTVHERSTPHLSIRAVGVILALASVLGACTLLPTTPSGNTTAPLTSCNRPSPVTTTPAFPLRVAGGARHLVDAAGRPFFMQGDAAWSLMAQLSRESVERYLDDRRTCGFNTILVSLLEHKFATNAPSNIYGEAPFTSPGSFATPNAAYFAHVDWVIQRAAAKGFLVLAVPAYLGYGGGDEGWYSEMLASGPDALRAYGRFLGARYRSSTNVIWVQGGDYDPPRKDLVDAIAQGIAETAPGSLQTAHTAPESTARGVWGDRAWLALDNVYTYGDVYAPSAGAYNGSARPFFLIESNYENEHGVGTARLRTQAYHAVLTGAMGHVFGNNPVWHFDGPGLYDVGVSWQAALGSSGSQSMAHLGDLLTRRAWWTLRPDLDGRFLVGGAGSGTDRVAAAVASDRTFAIAYLPSARAVSVDLGQLTGPSVRLTWFDPSSGLTQPAAGPVPASGRVDLSPPGTNSAGDPDWVLVVENA